MSTPTTVTADRRPAPRPRGEGPSAAAVFLAALLLVLGSVSWRRGEYFDGSLDPVVVAKAVVGVLALGLAFVLAHSGVRHRLGTGSLWFLGLVLTCSVFGALTAGHLVAGGVVAVRAALVGGTVFLLLRAAPAIVVLTALIRACVVVAVLAAVTGLPSSADGRLSGGIPAIDPNELALLAGVGVLYVAWRMVLDDAGPAHGLAAAGLLAIIWASGSRTALLMLGLGVLLVLVHLRRPRPGLVIGSLVFVAGTAVAVAVTGAVGEFLSRGGDGSSTLDSRFIAWRAALTWADSAWQTAFGGGLSVKIIRVQGQYWDTQPLDSSWVSLLVQAGWLGVVLAAVWVLWILRGVLAAARPHRVLLLGLLAFLLGRSVLESGLFDASVAFTLFVAISLVAERGSRERLRAEATPGPLPAPTTR
ncbi:hypothetical protein [Trujillonella endophytica]|uniref:O-antigen ligase n=1 Tax=Trujillonella endophytica TaxID=673521 RepID=A0A1H8SLR8_9ACTN|nr:hypothetical protein [Trujillella endophytica]SEO79143.1 hypothetical protein SAMN05660991_01793 [Trujillella endophytica]